jgi:hypothetical protein
MIPSMKLLVGLYLGLLLGCSSIQVSQDYLPDTEFYNLKTYQWQSEKQKSTGNERIDNPLLDKRIRTAIDNSLLEMGYKKIETGSPDFYVAYTYALRSKIESRDSGTNIGFGFGKVGRYSSIGINSGQEINEYDQANLLIDFTNSKTKDLIWRGNGTRRMADHYKPEKITEIVNEMVSKILAQFPPLPS